MATTVNYLVWYDAKTKKEAYKRYRKPASIIQARADAIAILRSGKVGLPSRPFSMVTVAICKDVPPGQDPVDGLLEQVIMSRALIRHRVHECARTWNDVKKQWNWLYDNGTIRHNAEAW